MLFLGTAGFSAQPASPVPLPPEQRTDTSLFWRKARPREYVAAVSSVTGDLWNEVGHHGPAIENAWAGYRIYFDRKAAMDVYSKPRPSIELRTTGWYLPEELKGKGYGMDHYFVGNTIGLGSIRLWRDGVVQMLDPVTLRSAQVVTEGPVSWLDFVSRGIPWGDEAINVSLRLTVYAGYRHATLEAWVQSTEPVQLVTGINRNPDLRVEHADTALLTWGRHNSLVADHAIDVGAAVIVDPAAIAQSIEEADQVLLISKPTRYLKLWITSANEEEVRLNSWPKFQAYVAELGRQALGRGVGVPDGPDADGGVISSPLPGVANQP